MRCQQYERLPWQIPGDPEDYHNGKNQPRHPRLPACTGSDSKKHQKWKGNDHQRIKTQGGKEIPVEKLMHRSCCAASGAIKTGQIAECASRQEICLIRINEVQRCRHYGNNTNDRDRQKLALSPVHNLRSRSDTYYLECAHYKVGQQTQTKANPAPHLGLV